MRGGWYVGVHDTPHVIEVVRDPGQGATPEVLVDGVPVKLELTTSTSAEASDLSAPWSGYSFQVAGLPAWIQPERVDLGSQWSLMVEGWSTPRFIWALPHDLRFGAQAARDLAASDAEAVKSLRATSGRGGSTSFTEVAGRREVRIIGGGPKGSPRVLEGAIIAWSDGEAERLERLGWRRGDVEFERRWAVEEDENTFAEVVADVRLALATLDQSAGTGARLKIVGVETGGSVFRKAWRALDDPGIVQVACAIPALIVVAIAAIALWVGVDAFARWLVEIGGRAAGGADLRPVGGVGMILFAAWGVLRVVWIASGRSRTVMTGRQQLGAAATSILIGMLGVWLILAAVADGMGRPSF